MPSPQQPWQHTKSPRVSSLSFHRYDITTSMIILIKKNARRYNFLYNGVIPLIFLLNGYKMHFNVDLNINEQRSMKS